MPKEVEYPRASFEKSLELAQAVGELGGSCKIESCAHKLGKKDSGAFRALVSAADKYGFIQNNRGQLSTTDLFREYKLAYSDKDGTEVLQKAFLGVPLFSKIVDRFRTEKLPVEIFDKLLIKEFGVHEQIASRVTKYFMDGARSAKLLNEDNTLALSETSDQGEDHQEDLTESSEEIKSATPAIHKLNPTQNPDTYSVTISGPGINSTIVILEEDDLLIVEAMLNKVKKKLREQNNGQIGLAEGESAA